MALINQNSIIGVTSITSPSASNVLTFHTNNTTERLRVSTSGVSFSGTNASLDTSGNLTVSGNVSVGGTLTYEDVTNIDSVGIITARAGVSVPDGQKIQLGNSNDLQIYHNGSHSLIDEAGTGNLVIRSNLISFERYTNEQLARFTSEGSCEFYYDDSKKLETTNTGATITNDLVLNHASGDKAIRWATGGTNKWSLYHNNSAGALVAYDNDQNAERLRITSAGRLGIGIAAPSRDMVHIHNSTANASSYIQFTNANTGGTGTNDGTLIGISQNNSNTDGTGSGFTILQKENAEITLGTNNIERLRITSDGKVGVGSDNPGQTLSISGASAGLGIYNTGNNHGNVYFFKNGTPKGWLKYRGDNDTLLIGNVTDSIHVATDGDVAIGGATPVDRLTVYNSNNGNATGITIRNTNSSSTYSHARLRLESQNAAAYAHLWADVANSALRLGYNSSSTVNIKSDGRLGVGIMDPSQAKLVAQTASGMSIAAVKDNTGASISLGGVTQPRILMEAGASASQFKLYTSSGSSYSSPDWRQRLHITPTNASVSSSGSGANGIGCFGINDTSPDSKALALSLRGTYGMEDPRPLVYLQRSYGVGGGSSTDETTLEISAPGSYNSAGVVYGIKSRAQHNLNGSHYAGHFEGHGSQYSANGTSALYAKTTKLDTNGGGDVIAFRADASITQGSSNNGAAIAGYFASGNNVNGKPIVCQNGYTTNSYSNQIIFRKHNGSGIVDVGSIKSNNSNTQYNTSSDYRLKENIVSLTGAIDRLKQLQPKRFNFIGIDETIDGFIAHEVNPVAPYAVSGEKDAVKKELVLDEDGKEQFDENGEIIEREVIDPQGVDYSKLTTLTIAALQEALAKIETLEAKVAVLEGS